jgi:DNA-binding protein HU-beta
MNEPLTFLAAGPTAFVARITNGRGRSQKGFSALPGRGREAFSEIVQRLEGAPDALKRLIPGRRRRKKLPAFIPHRSQSPKGRGRMKLARNLGAAASATVFAVDAVAEMRRAADARRNKSSAEGENGSAGSPAAGKRNGSDKAAPSKRKAASPTRKATPTKTAPAKPAPAAKKASAAKKAPAKRVATTG